MSNEWLELMTTHAYPDMLAREIDVLLTSCPSGAALNNEWIPWLTRQADILNKIAVAAPERSIDAMRHANKTRKLIQILVAVENMYMGDSDDDKEP